MNYETNKIRRFLQAYFNDQELTTFCFDYFPDVYNDFTDRMPKKQKVQMLLEHCQQQGRWPALMAALERERSPAYAEQFAAAPRVEPAPQPRVPVQRNPRQIFISHSHQDAEFAHRLADDLQERGWQTWIVPDSIRPGEKWVEAINRGLEESGIFVLVLTPDAVNSDWVRDETNVAIELKREGKLRLLPLLVKPCDVPPLWRLYQRISFQRNYRDGLQTLITILQSDIIEPPKQPLVPDVSSLASITTSVTKARTFFKETVPVWGWGILALVILSLSVWGAGKLGGGDSGDTTPVAEEMTREGEEVAGLTPTPTDKPMVTSEPTLSPAPTKPPSPTATQQPTHTPTPTPKPTATPTPILDPSVPPPNAALHDTWTRPTDGMMMVYVPGGTFNMGTAENAPGTDSDEYPRHEVRLGAYWLDKTEVTNAHFAAFLNEKGNQEQGGVTWLDFESRHALISGDNGIFEPKSGFADHPVIEVSWYGADAYCQWVGGQLPTEAQWEYAARGKEDYIYPWGNQTPTCTLAQFDSCSSGLTLVDTEPVGRFSPAGDSWVDATDMAGNVWEWVADWYNRDYWNSSDENPVGPETGNSKVLRGGGWSHTQQDLRVANRLSDAPNARYYNLGFRCAVVPGS